MSKMNLRPLCLPPKQVFAANDMAFTPSLSPLISAPSLAPSPDPRFPAWSFDGMLEQLPPPAIPLLKRGRERSPTPQRDGDTPRTPWVTQEPTTPPPLRRNDEGQHHRKMFRPVNDNIVAARVLRF